MLFTPQVGAHRSFPEPALIAYSRVSYDPRSQRRSRPPATTSSSRRRSRRVQSTAPVFSSNATASPSIGVVSAVATKTRPPATAGDERITAFVDGGEAAVDHWTLPVPAARDTT